VEWRLDHGAEIATIEAGDLLVLIKLTGWRATLDLLQIVDQIGRQGAGFESFGEPWADTSSSASPAANQ
jgi:hypothetical protein